MESKPDKALNIDRIKALSDGVIAVAMTILVLDLKLPAHASLPTSSALWMALKQDGMQVLAYLISFALIANYWLAHYAIFNAIDRVNKPITIMNLIFLLTITFIPFPVSILTSSDTALATIFYNASLMMPALILIILNCMIGQSVAQLFPSKSASELKVIATKYYRSTLHSGPVIIIGLLSSIVCLFNNAIGGYIWLLLSFSGMIMTVLNKWFSHYIQ